MIDGRWIANFGCADSSTIRVEGGRVWTTESYLAESLAIADALIQIDALATRPKAI